MQPDNSSAAVSDADRQLIAAAYKAFNARQIDAVLATMHPDVAWPRAWEGDYVQGDAQVRAYWTQQWQEISPVVEPIELNRLPDGRTAVLVQQTVHDLRGKLLHEGQTSHVYTIRQGLIQRMDIQQVAP
ncbi:MAG: nuclear transport factor 2 family protein [Hymenobacter sp.]|nr:MAG: nuclear transport factor 2 family protein [Hymenobacter sp.]